MSAPAAKPFPALTPSQRLHLEVNGFVLLPEVLDRPRIDALLEATYGIEEQFRRTGELPGPSCFNTSTSEEFFRIDNLPHLHPAYFDYLTDPYIVGMAEEIVGGPVRLEQSDAHIRRPKAAPDGNGESANDQPRRYGFHRGINPAYSHTANGLYHFSFIKALTNLTDLGPGDGGTTVIPGTHKIPTDVAQEDIIAAAMDDPSLIYSVEAPAGSTLLFYESLVHAAGIIDTGRDRVLILGGYTPTMFQSWNGYDHDPDFVETLSDEHRALITGNSKFHWPRQSRTLGQKAATPAQPTTAPEPV